MNEIIFKDLKIEHISKRGLKNSYITVKPFFIKGSVQTKVLLKTPHVSEHYIYELLEQREQWIRKSIEKVYANLPQNINLEDELLLFGELYSIDHHEALKLRTSLERLRVNDAKNVLKCYDRFYKNYAQEYLSQRLKHHASLMKLNYTEIKFRKMKSRWGSCNSQGVITLNTQLMKIKQELIEYVIVHELAHLVHMNHSKKFHDLVKRYLPNAKQLRSELKKVNILF